MNPTVSALINFFGRTLSGLEASYRWRIRKIDGFWRSGEAGYGANLDLKCHLHQRWNAATDEQKLDLAYVIVSDWGGVRRNTPTTLRRYVEAVAELVPQTPLKGVASYSKIFSIARPDTFAIYDARVAACMNAVQINAGIRRGIAFNYVPGRNNVVGNTVTKRGFTQLPRFSVRSLVKSGWMRIKRDETYAKYMEVLSDCIKKLPGHNLTQLEMALFANAECECQLAMGKGKRPNKSLQRTLDPSPTALPRRGRRLKCR